MQSGKKVLAVSFDAWPRVTLLDGAADAARRALSTKMIPVRVSVRERLISEVRSQLGSAEYKQAYTLGSAMGLEDAISYATEKKNPSVLGPKG